MKKMTPAQFKKSNGTIGNNTMYDHSNGMRAVKYDHATDQVLESHDMLEYFTFAKLTA